MFSRANVILGSWTRTDNNETLKPVPETGNILSCEENEDRFHHFASLDAYEDVTLLPDESLLQDQFCVGDISSQENTSKSVLVKELLPTSKIRNRKGR